MEFCQETVNWAGFQHCPERHRQRDKVCRSANQTDGRGACNHFGRRRKDWDPPVVGLQGSVQHAEKADEGTHHSNVPFYMLRCQGKLLFISLHLFLPVSDLLI